MKTITSIWKYLENFDLYTARELLEGYIQGRVKCDMQIYSS